jgi:S-adenosylmethionine-diacylgycerolhomoserine-N-methlytransferase
MDALYRYQRYVYDATRKFYLLGRDRLVADLAPGPGDRVLEVACGTGRNLIAAARRYPQARFFGFDISAAMLETACNSVARARLGDRIRIAAGDATDFSGERLFETAAFDRIFISYALSMIPPWRGALQQALGALATSEGRSGCRAGSNGCSAPGSRSFPSSRAMRSRGSSIASPPCPAIACATRRSIAAMPSMRW